MSKFRLADYLGQMKKAAECVLSYVDGMSEADFLADPRTQQAVLMNLMFLGETATRLHKNYNSFVLKHDEFPWREMSAMRNRIAHGYLEIDYKIVWVIVQESTPQILQITSNIHVDDFDIELDDTTG